MADYIIESRKLTAGYGKAVIIQDIDFQAERKKVTAIVGPNGSGKSTFLKTLFGLTRVFNGKVIFDGEDITKLAPEARARKGLGFVFQVNNVFPNLTVKENLEMGAYARKDKEEIKKDMEEILDIFPILRERQKQKAGSLSGGERQMLAMAMALMGRPKLLLLDEPAAALAPKVVTQIFMKIRDIVNSGVTVILVEQHAKRALSFCDMGYVFSSGRIVMKGPGKDLLADEKFVEAFLGKR